MTSLNQDVPDERKIQFRIGVNLGDVIEDGGDIFGDGVNVAARLEGLAEPGGICISDAVRAAIGKKLDLGYEFMGAQVVKNIAEPVRAYRVLTGKEETTSTLMQSQVLELPNKPSIVVLPFTNMSGDPEQEYFSDGITEDIITELARFRSLFVIARHSSFTFKNHSSNVQAIGKNLGVQYIVEGSVRRSGDRVRISAQLIEAATGNQIWAEKYDRLLDDIFEVQDEVTRTIVATLPGHLEGDYAERTRRKPTASMTAYDYLLHGHMYCHRLTRDDNAKAQQKYHKAIELDQNLAQAHAWLAWTYQLDYYFVWEKHDSTKLASESINRALTLDENDSFIRTVYAFTLRRDGRPEEAEMQFEKAVELNPNDPIATAWFAEFLVSRGRSTEALQWVEEAIRRDPRHVDWNCIIQGEALYCLRDYKGAVRVITQARLDDNYWGNALLAASYAQIDNMEEARTAAQRVVNFRNEAQMSGHPLPFSDLEFDFAEDTDLDHFRDGLRKAGLIK
jgi:adenylate cyclase